LVPEAPLRATDAGLVPEGEGWFVVNAREARWWEDAAFGAFTRFEGDERFPRLGVNIGVLAPGQPACMYHREDEQENFLVLAGECLLLVEGKERRLRAWDFVHCPLGTDHVFVGAGEGDCVLLAMGTRSGGGVFYPVADVALRHRAGVERETSSSTEAYEGYPKPTPTPFREDWLPGG
jgi:uncharacterized cupin superfamily protein